MLTSICWNHLRVIRPSLLVPVQEYLGEWTENSVREPPLSLTTVCGCSQEPKYVVAVQH